MTLKINITPELQEYLHTTEGVWNIENAAMVYAMPSDVPLIAFPCHDDRRTFAVNVALEVGRYYWLKPDGSVSEVPIKTALRSLTGSMQYDYHIQMLHAFGVDKAYDALLRDMRFGEEAIELLQARGRSRAEAHRLVDYVYDRPVGIVEQEMGGVLTTLMAMASQQHIDLEDVTRAEMARFTRKNRQIAVKSLHKPDLTDRAQAEIDRQIGNVVDTFMKLPDQYKAEAPKVFHDPGLNANEICALATEAWKVPGLTRVTQSALRLMAVVHLTTSLYRHRAEAPLFTALPAFVDMATGFVEAVNAGDLDKAYSVAFSTSDLPPDWHDYVLTDPA